MTKSLGAALRAPTSSLRPFGPPWLCPSRPSGAQALWPTHCCIVMHRAEIHRAQMHCTRMHRPRMHRIQIHCTRMHRTLMHRTWMHRTRMHRTRMMMMMMKIPSWWSSHRTQMMMIVTMKMMMMIASYTDVDDCHHDDHCIVHGWWWLSSWWWSHHTQMMMIIIMMIIASYMNDDDHHHLDRIIHWWWWLHRICIGYIRCGSNFGTDGGTNKAILGVGSIEVWWMSLHCSKYRSDEDIAQKLRGWACGLVKTNQMKHSSVINVVICIFPKINLKNHKILHSNCGGGRVGRRRQFNEPSKCDEYHSICLNITLKNHTKTLHRNCGAGRMCRWRPIFNEAMKWIQVWWMSLYLSKNKPEESHLQLRGWACEQVETGGSSVGPVRPQRATSCSTLVR